MKKNRKRVERTGTETAKPQVAAELAAAAGAAETGRDANGRFAAGNSGGPGNPFARQTAAFRQALRNAVTDQDMKEIAYMLLFKSKSGDLAATKLLLQYCIGKPEAPVNPDRVDVDEYHLFREQTTQGEELANVLNNLPAETACTLLRLMVPAVGARILLGLRDGFDERAAQAAEKQQRAEAVAAERALEAKLDDEACDEDEVAVEKQAAPRSPVEQLAELLRPLAAQLGAAPMANGGNGRHAPAGNGHEERPGHGANGR